MSFKNKNTEPQQILSGSYKKKRVLKYVRKIQNLFSRNHDNSPDFKGICEFLFACCQECVEVYDKVFTENKNQKIRAKNAKIGFATTRKRHFREERSI